MSDEFNHLNDEEKLKAENDFLKMKLMLENGAQFGSMNSSNELPPEIENEFLKNIMAFEAQSSNPVYIKVFDKIGRPTHFIPVTEISDNEIDEAWNSLLSYLEKYNINFDVCSPNISNKELYRFVTEELFEHEMSDINLPGMTTNFTYDEFYPDAVYDNSNTATEDCINYILQKEPFEWTHHFKDDNLRFNEYFPLTIDEFKAKPNNYKNAYSNVEIKKIEVVNCVIKENNCCVNGVYNIEVTTEIEKLNLNGNWKVNFEKDEELGYWYIYQVTIEGIKF